MANVLLGALVLLHALGAAVWSGGTVAIALVDRALPPLVVALSLAAIVLMAAHERLGREETPSPRRAALLGVATPSRWPRPLHARGGLPAALNSLTAIHLFSLVEMPLMTLPEERL